LNRKTAYATLTLTLAAEAPDLDVLGRFAGRAFGFAHHRGFTHSFLGGILVAAVVVAFVYALHRFRRRTPKPEDPPPRWCMLFGFAYLACLSHILLDFTNNYGVRPLWPFSGRWFSWDIIFIVEPVLLIFLIGGLVAPLLTSLINEEIGARQQGPPGKFAARVALAGILLTWGIRDYEHRRAVATLQSRLYQNETPRRVSAYPYWGNPFRWYGVVETTTSYLGMHVDSLAPEAGPEDEPHIHYKPQETPITEAARKSFLGRAYFGWAQYPITETETLPAGGYRVRLFDVRFDYPEISGRRTLSATVDLDAQLHVIAGDGVGVNPN
jgi:inner membrane protein